MVETIVSIIVVSAFIIAFLAASRLLRLDLRVMVFSFTLTIVSGLASFSAFSALTQAAGFLSSLPPGEQLTIIPIVLAAQLLVGTYVGSHMSGVSYAKFLGFTMAVLGFTCMISFPFIVLISIVK